MQDSEALSQSESKRKVNYQQMILSAYTTSGLLDEEIVRLNGKLASLENECDINDEHLKIIQGKARAAEGREWLTGFSRYPLSLHFVLTV